MEFDIVVIVPILSNSATRKQLGSRHSWRVRRLPGCGDRGRLIPGMFPQKYRPRLVAETYLASTTTGLHCMEEEGGGGGERDRELC